jgi:hypothetical protein
VIESILEKGEVDLVRSGESVGTLAFRPTVLEGVLLPPAVENSLDRGREPEGVKVVVTTMRMSDAARTRLSDAFGDSYLVVDFADAPSTADVVLTHPVSTQLINRWTLMFPQARILVTEILDEELGLDVRGPVGRLLDAGAHGYLPRRPVDGRRPAQPPGEHAADQSVDRDVPAGPHPRHRDPGRGAGA